jgi:adenylate cyclase
MAYETITCAYCGRDQPPAAYCLGCHVHMTQYAGIKDRLMRFEAELGFLRSHLRDSSRDAAGSLAALKNLVEVYQGLRLYFEKLSRSQREMATLAEVGKAVNSVLEMGHLLDLIMDMAIKVMEAERGFLMLKDEETGALMVQVARNMEAALKEKAHWTVSSNICSRVANEGRSILATDAQKEGAFQGMHSVMAQQVRSLLCVPLKLKSGDVIGVIYVDNRTASGVFTDESVEFLVGFANHAAIAIDNARLYENVQKETKARLNLQRYLSPNVVDDVLNKKEALTLGGSSVVCSVLFADICGFTPLSQQLPPEEVVRMLNEYFTIMADVIFQHRGTLDKFIGDAVMAVFGAPVTTPDHAKHAVTAAMAMIKETRALQDKAVREGRQAFQIRIGINSGPVVAGNIGSPDRIDYTVIGDTVNLAARLEPKAPANGVVISDATYQLVKDCVTVNKWPSVEIKGRTGEVEVYEVLEALAEDDHSDGKQQRRHDRLDVSLFAIYRELQHTKMYQGSIKNISSDGVQLSTREKLPAGAQIVLTFSLPGGEKIGDVHGQVMRSQALVDDRGKDYFKLGVMFTHCSDENKEKIIRAWNLAN